MAAATIELPFLSSHYAIAESTLSTLTEAPTVELVNQLLEAITKKAREFDELKSDKLRLEVELENAVRSSDTKIKVLKSSVEKGHAEVEETRKKLHESGNITATTLFKSMLTRSRKYTVFARVRNRDAEVIVHVQRIRSQHS